MTQCNRELGQLALGFQADLPIHVRFDAPQTSSDGGALLLRQVDDRLRLSRGAAGCLTDPRAESRVKHSREEQVRQRVLQIALGYEDCNDADGLRRDPMLLTACGRTPDDVEGLSSQPTLSRMENGVDWASVKRLTRFLIRSYVDALPANTDHVVLDIDSTDDETHGGQQLSFFHGFYDHHMYHPLLVFDGESGQLIAALLRPGNTHASRGARVLLRVIIRALKARFPEISIVVRGDSGFAMPSLMTDLEGLSAELGDIDYLFGIAKNPVLLRKGQGAMVTAAEQYRQTRAHVRHFEQFSYAAESWPHERLIIMKAEHAGQGANPRFVVTSLAGFPPELIYTVYCWRGQAENYIKQLKNALFADRLSCSGFVANAFRLLLHALAYRLLLALRDELRRFSPALGTAQFDTIRLRVLKVAAFVTRSVRRILVRLPASFPLADVFARTAWSLMPAPA